MRTRLRGVELLPSHDAFFLHVETPSVQQHFGGLAILDPSTSPGGRFLRDDLAGILRDRLHLLPRLRQRLAYPAGNLSRPVWVDDPDFDIDRHVRRAILPPPRGRRELVDLIQAVISRPLRRDRPLWEVHVVEDMDGYGVMIIKVHHSMGDGLSVIQLATALMMDRSPEVERVEPVPWRPRVVPEGSLVRGALAGQFLSPAVEAAAFVRDFMRAPRTELRRAGAATAGILELARAGQAPPGPLNTAIRGSRRRYAMTEVPIADIRRIKSSLGGTVNDVVLAAATTALHRLLVARGERTTGGEVRVMVPVSIRTRAQTLAMTNRTSTLSLDLPLGAMSATERLAAVARVTHSLKKSHQAEAARLIMDSLGVVAPPSLHRFLARKMYRGRWFNVIVSNIPGAQTTRYMSGCRLVAGYPLMPLAEDVPLTIGATRWAGTMGFGLTGDWDLAPDLDDLGAAIDESFADLRRAARA